MVIACALVASLCLPAQAANAPIPNFSPNPVTSWFFDREDGDNFLPPLNGPGPVVSDPDHPYRPNGDGEDAAGDPTYRISNLTNPILTPWAIERMRPTNDAVRAGEIPFEAAERCYPPWRSRVEHFSPRRNAHDFFRAGAGKVLII